MLDIKIKKPLHGSHGSMDLDIAISIEEYAFIVLSGQSGSGKTTLLRVLAGLENAHGEIRVNGETWLKEGYTMPPQQRHIGFVFQDYALFENMSVEKNLLFVNNDADLAQKLLQMTALENLKERLPNRLSGGQKQRVALCRAMMKRPKLLLMDEPLSALDSAMRHKLQDDILKLHKAFGTTTIMVSHDPSEIYKLAQQVIVLEAGKVTQKGTPREVLLQTQGSQKFSLHGEILEILKADVIFIGVVAIGQQIVEVVLDANEVEFFEVGQEVQVSTKAFSPSISPL